MRSRHQSAAGGMRFRRRVYPGLSPACTGRPNRRSSIPLPKSAAASPAVPLPFSKVYPEIGWAIMRTSWDEEAPLLAVKSGYRWNQTHADASTFILYQKGSPLIVDSGTCNYSRPEYTDYCRQSQAHNALFLNGEGQPTNQIGIRAKFRGSILKWFDALGVQYIRTDATGPKANLFTQHYSHFLWIGKPIVIFDACHHVRGQ